MAYPMTYLLLPLEPSQTTGNKQAEMWNGKGLFFSTEESYIDSDFQLQLILEKKSEKQIHTITEKIGKILIVYLR